MEEANVLSNYDVQHATFIYMTIEAEEEELYLQSIILKYRNSMDVLPRFQSMVTSMSTVNSKEYLKICTVFFNALTSGSLSPDCCFSFLPSIYKFITAVGDMNIVTFLLRILIFIFESRFCIFAFCIHS